MRGMDISDEGGVVMATTVSSELIAQVSEVEVSVIETIRQTQADNLEAAGQLVANSFLNGGTFFVTGSGHSHTAAEEFYARAGMLAFVKPILTSELTITEHPTKSSRIERLSGYAEILADLYRIAGGDVVMIVSNSGRNAYPVQLAIEAARRGASVIAVTSVRHSHATSSRDPSGKHLLDVANIVIDNGGVEGDAALHVEGISAAVCPTSSVANTFIVQSINVLAAKRIADHGKEPPIFVSLNSENAEHANDEYFRAYTRLY